MGGKLDDIFTDELNRTLYHESYHDYILKRNAENVLNNNVYQQVKMPGAVTSVKYKYAEDEIIRDFTEYLNSTYGEHYMSDNEKVECFDVWLALGDSVPTFRNTAIKYLWRYGKKDGSNKKDLFKVLHYTLMCLYADHYKKGE